MFKGNCQILKEEERGKLLSASNGAFFPFISQFWFTSLNADEFTHIPQQSILMLCVELMAKHLPTSIKKD